MTRARNGAAPVAPARATPPLTDKLASLIDGTPNGGWATIDGQEVEHHGDGVISVDGGERVEMFAPRPSRHGATQSKASRRKAGRVRLEVWITEAEKRQLEWIRSEDGHDFAAIVGGHIRAEYEERKGER